MSDRDPTIVEELIQLWEEFERKSHEADTRNATRDEACYWDAASRLGNILAKHGVQHDWPARSDALRKEAQERWTRKSS